MAEQAAVLDECSSATALKENEDADDDSDVAVGGQGDCGVHEQTEKKSLEDRMSSQDESGDLSDETVPNDDDKAEGSL